VLSVSYEERETGRVGVGGGEGAFAALGKHRGVYV